MTLLLSFGIVLTLCLVAVILFRWWNLEVIGVTPVHTFTFIAILFTSGLDVGLIMFPLFDFAAYADLETSPQYAFSNPLAIEFGFWGFLIWAFYFLTSFYFCVIEPRIKFFEIPAVKLINNTVIIGTCAFTGYLFLIYLPSYIPFIGDGESVVATFYLIVFATIVAASYSSTDIKFVRILSLSSTWAFFALIAFMAIAAGMALSDLGTNLLSALDYFPNIHHFIFPIDDYHAFYLFWWFAWSVMIGQFTSRFVGGLKTWQVFLALLIFPSIPLAIWFSVIYFYFQNDIPTEGIRNVAMILVGITFVINSLDSLIRLYTDNLNLTTKRFGKAKYIAGNVAMLFGLVLLFRSGWLQIEYIGAVVIALYVSCLIFILWKKRSIVANITTSPEGNTLDYSKINQAQ